MHIAKCWQISSTKIFNQPTNDALKASNDAFSQSFHQSPVHGQTTVTKLDSQDSYYWYQEKIATSQLL